MTQDGLQFYLINSLTVIITFSAVFLTLFLLTLCARARNWFSAQVFEALGPALPFSLLVASVVWSVFAASEVILEGGLPAWAFVRGVAVVLMVALVGSPITILLGIPMCAFYFLFGRRIPAEVIYIY